MGTPLERLVDGLNPEQAAAVARIRGPVCILAGAGSGKTTTITRRIAHQVASGAFEPERILAVTFTDKAAREMGSRLAGLGVSGVRARTFHAEALAQYRAMTGGNVEILPSKTPLLLPLVQRLPMPYKFTAVREVAGEIEWARNRRIPVAGYEAALGERKPPIPADLMAGIYGTYQRRKEERGVLDFEDLLERTLLLLEEAGPAAQPVLAHYQAFSVDEYQDVNLLQQSLLAAWVGERRDLCVVGDDYQSIFGFTGASPRYLIDFPARYPDCLVVNLERNYRSTPEVLTVANRLAQQFGPAPRVLRAASAPASGAGAAGAAAPALRTFGTGVDEVLWLVSEARRLHTEGLDWEEIAVLYRINGRSEPLEAALAAAHIPYQVAGAAFLRRPAARAVMAALRRSGSGGPLVAEVEGVVERLGYRPGASAADLGSDDEVTRQADLGRLLALAAGYDGEDGAAGFVADLQRRFAPEAEGRGLQILTYHRAKGKEFDAVFLPRLEDKELPFALAASVEEREEERRLLYVGVTRARRHLFLSWAASREDNGKRLSPSPFLDEIRPRSAAPIARPAPGPRVPDSPLLAALKEWRREEARERALPAYVIFHDKTLASIASARPTSAGALLAISGVGPAKVDNYGEAVLAVVKEHAGAS